MADDFADIRADLLAQRTATLGSGAALSRDTATLDASQSSGDSRVRGFEDGDALSVERELIASLSSSNAAVLAEIDRALKAIDQGTYGSCERCAGAIPRPRLEARPRSTRCVPCASRA